MRPIKFRGRRSDNGELVYGNGIYQDLPVTEKQKELGFVSRTYIIGTEFLLVAKLWHPVDPESVAQLVGFDRDDKEVYEDDTLIDQNGREYTISDDIQVELFCGGVYEPLYSTRYKFKLKEG